MTEEFVLKKLEEYEKIIISLKKENKELKEELNNLKKTKKKKRTVKPKIVEEPKKEAKWNINLPIDNGKTVTVTGVPEETVEPNNKIYVKSAERELSEMIGEES